MENVKRGTLQKRRVAVYVRVINPHVQRERGKVIGVGVHIYIRLIT